MKGRLFLFHWNNEEAAKLAEPLRARGWQVETESEDGARGCKAIQASLPDAVVIYLRRLPSHGRHTAAYLRETKATQDLPIIFVDGNPEAVQTTKEKVPQASYIPESELFNTLEEYATQEKTG